MTIIRTIASAILMSSSVSAASKMHLSPSVEVQTETFKGKEEKGFLKGKVLGINKKIVAGVAVVAILGIIWKYNKKEADTGSEEAGTGSAGE